MSAAGWILEDATRDERLQLIYSFVGKNNRVSTNSFNCTFPICQATITNHQQPARKMDYNNPTSPNYHCHQSGSTKSPPSREALGMNEAKGAKLKALQNGSVPDLSNGHSNGRLVRPEQLLLGHHHPEGGMMSMATNGHSNISHRQQQQHDDNREAVENVMPSNKSQQRYFSNEKALTVTYQNNTNNNSNNQQTAGILKPKDQSSNALEKDHKSTLSPAGHNLVARGNGVIMSLKVPVEGDYLNHVSSNGAVRRLRNRSESAEPGDVYHLVNGGGGRANGQEVNCKIEDVS